MYGVCLSLGISIASHFYLPAPFFRRKADVCPVRPLTPGTDVGLGKEKVKEGGWKESPPEPQAL